MARRSLERTRTDAASGDGEEGNSSLVSDAMSEG
jgi:hypothetical protein